MSDARSFAARVLVLAAFFASGVAALAFETLWFRQTSLAFGNSVWASAIVLSGFMGGMAFGYAFGGSVALRTRKPLQLFAALELSVAISGVGLVYLLPQLPPFIASISGALEQKLWLLNAVRLGLAFVLMLLPAAAMGMSLPLLLAAWQKPAQEHAGFARLLGGVYGINTLGAVLGSGITEHWLIVLWGVRGSALAAAGCNVLAASLAWVAGRSWQLPALANVVTTRTSTNRWLYASFAAGFALLALEIVWLRFLTLYLNDTDGVFAWLLGCVLSGIALGSLSARLWRGLRSDLVACFAFAALVFSFRFETWFIAHYFRFDMKVVSLAAPLVLPTALASGLLFAALGGDMLKSGQTGAAAAGRLALWNTLGGVAGSLAAGFVLLPSLGIERSLLVLALVYLATTLLLAANGGRRARLAVAGLAVAAVFPYGSVEPLLLQASIGRWMRPGDRVEKTVEGTAATYSHVVHNYHDRPLFDQLATNAYSMSVNDFAARRYMKQFVYLPRALHPKLERALVIGYGIGSTVAALVDDQTLKQLDLVDTSREALDLSRGMHTQAERSPLDDPRVHVHIEDGRHYLEGHHDPYDLITGEPPPPIIAGVVNLYTQEYFERVRSRLAVGGMATYWLPLMNLSVPATQSIIAAFCGAFSDCSLWHGSARNLMLLGTRDAGVAHGPVDSDHFNAQWRNPKLLPELYALGFEVPAQLGATFIADAPVLAELTRGMPALNDDHPKRVSIAGNVADREALLWKLRDTKRARQRFMQSPLIGRLWPADVRQASQRQFENQRLLNDLMFSETSPARQTQVLHQVLQNTPLRLPVLLLLRSDPDIQKVIAHLPPAELYKPEWQMDRVAYYLAERDFSTALQLLQNVPAEALPFKDLPEYVDTALERSASR
jgi:predicted membrane-bound spermidine synthase